MAQASCSMFAEPHRVTGRAVSFQLILRSDVVGVAAGDDVIKRKVCGALKAGLRVDRIVGVAQRSSSSRPWKCGNPDLLRSN
jgi:hypothetical protein